MLTYEDLAKRVANRRQVLDLMRPPGGRYVPCIRQHGSNNLIAVQYGGIRLVNYSPRGMVEFVMRNNWAYTRCFTNTTLHVVKQLLEDDSLHIDWRDDRSCWLMEFRDGSGAITGIYPVRPGHKITRKEDTKCAPVTKERNPPKEVVLVVVKTLTKEKSSDSIVGRATVQMPQPDDSGHRESLERIASGLVWRDLDTA